MTTGQVAPNPYVGPRPFRTGERLYGRDLEAAALVDRLLADRIVLLYSPSGAGKSSLIEAALIPALRDEEQFRVFPTLHVNLAPATDGPGATANRYIRSVLTAFEEGVPRERRLAEADLARLSLTEYLERQWPTTDDAQPEILIFDQFEEILTLDPTDQAAKDAFFAQVGAALRDRRRWAVFALREDFLAGLDPYRPGMPTQLKSSFRLDFLGPPAAQLAIQQPAQQVGVSIEQDAAEQLVEDLRQVRFLGPNNTVGRRSGPHVEPVQLQVVCLRLWEQRDRSRSTITTEDVKALGNVDTALADYFADRVHGIAAETGANEAAIREWFGRHLIVDQTIRGQVRHGSEQQQGVGDQVIRLLVDAHLVRSETRLGTPWYELTHDRLIDPVLQSNAAWFGGRASPLQQPAERWEGAGKPDGQLLREEELEAAETWAAAHPNDVTPLERAYLTESLRAQERAEKERQQAQHIATLFRVASVVSIVCVVLLVVAALFYAQSESALREATRQEQHAKDAQATAVVEASRATNAEARAVAEASRATSAQGTAEAEASNATRAKATAEAEAARATEAQARAQAAAATATEAQGRAEAAAQDARSQAELATSRQVAARSAAILTERLDLALLFAMAAERIRSTDEARESLRAALRQSPRLTTFLRGPIGNVQAAAFGADNDLVASGHANGSVILWSASTHKLIGAPLTGHTGPVRSVAFSPDGSVLASASEDGTVQVWEVSAGQPTGGPLATLMGHTDVVRSIAFSPDGSRLASASQDDSLIIWDLASSPPRESRRFQSEGFDFLSVAFSPNGTLLAAGDQDMKVRLWNVGDWTLAGPPLTGHTAAVLSVAFSPDGKTLASGSADATIRLWDVVGRKALGEPLHGHTNWVWGVAFSPLDGNLLASGGNDSALIFWDVKEGKPIGERLVQQTSVRSVAFSPSGALLASTSSDGTVLLWSAALREVVPTDQQDVWALAINPANPTMLASGGNDRSIALWDLTKREIVYRRTAAHSHSVRGLTFSPNGQMVASSASGRAGEANDIIVWNVVNGASLEDGRRLSGHTDLVYSVAFSPVDGSVLASGGADGTVRLWNVADGSQRRLMRPEQGKVRSVAFSPDGTAVAAGSDQGITAWDVASGQPLALPLPGQGLEILSITFSPDGTRMASGSSNNQVMLWEVASGRQMSLSPDGHHDDVRGVAFSPDSKTLASSSQDGSVIVWDVATGRQIGHPLKGHVGSVWSAAFTPDGATLLSGGQDSTVRFWDLHDVARVNVSDATLRSWKERACRIANRDLTSDEWQQYVGPILPYERLCPDAPPAESPP